MARRTVIRLRVPLACSAGAAWEAMHSPVAAGRLYAPWVALRPAPGPPFPPRWQPGDAREVQALLLGVVPFGRSLIAVGRGRLHLPGGEVLPAFHDGGGPLTGPLALLTGWDHRMAAEPVPGGGCVWHDRLVVTGAASVVLGPVLRLVWWLRAAGLRRAARDWQGG